MSVLCTNVLCYSYFSFDFSFNLIGYKITAVRGLTRKLFSTVGFFSGRKKKEKNVIEILIHTIFFYLFMFATNRIVLTIIKSFTRYYICSYIDYLI